MTKSELVSNDKKPAEMTGSCASRVTKRNNATNTVQQLFFKNEKAIKIALSLGSIQEKLNKSAAVISKNIPEIAFNKAINTNIGVDMMNIRPL